MWKHWWPNGNNYKLAQKSGALTPNILQGSVATRPSCGLQRDIY